MLLSVITGDMGIFIVNHGNVLPLHQSHAHVVSLFRQIHILICVVNTPYIHRLMFRLHGHGIAEFRHTCRILAVYITIQQIKITAAE